MVEDKKIDAVQLGFLQRSALDLYAESIAESQLVRRKQSISKHLQSKCSNIIAIGNEKSRLCALQLQPNSWPNKFGRSVKLTPRSVQQRQDLRSVPLYSPTLQVDDYCIMLR